MLTSKHLQLARWNYSSIAGYLRAAANAGSNCVSYTPHLLKSQQLCCGHLQLLLCRHDLRSSLLASMLILQCVHVLCSFSPHPVLDRQSVPLQYFVRIIT